jgi:hypothetical protein
MNWQTVSTNSNWHCTSVPYAVNSRIQFESTDGGGTYGSGDAWCADSTLQPGFTRGCFAPSVPIGCRVTTRALATCTKPADTGTYSVWKDGENAC